MIFTIWLLFMLTPSLFSTSIENLIEINNESEPNHFTNVLSFFRNIPTQLNKLFRSLCCMKQENQNDPNSDIINFNSRSDIITNNPYNENIDMPGCSTDMHYMKSNQGGKGFSKRTKNDDRSRYDENGLIEFNIPE